jgi:hypothetical protein
VEHYPGASLHCMLAALLANVKLGLASTNSTAYLSVLRQSA